MVSTQQSNNVLSSGGHGHILQKPHVPFELERFQFFPLSLRSKVHTKERSFQGVEEKKAQSDSVTFSLSPFMFCITCLFCFLVLSQSSFMLCVFSFMFLFWLFSVCFTLFFIKIKNKNFCKIRKIQK